MSSLKLMVMVVFVTGLMAGCKSVQTDFLNTTQEPLELQVHGPGLNVGSLGVVPAGGKLRTTIQVSTFWLPTTYNWTAGENQGSFTITSDSKEFIQVGIPMGVKANEPAWEMAEGKKQTGVHSTVTFAP